MKQLYSSNDIVFFTEISMEWAYDQKIQQYEN